MTARRLRRAAIGCLVFSASTALVRVAAFTPAGAARAWVRIAQRGHGGMR